jgi:hypothetical protein
MPKNALKALLPKTTAARSFLSASTASPESVFQCPACGAMVDGADHREVATHHAHVLHPNFFNFEKRTGT